MRHHRMSFRPTLLFRELSLSKSWFSYMAPTLYKRFGRECSRIRSDGRRFSATLNRAAFLHFFNIKQEFCCRMRFTFLRYFRFNNLNFLKNQLYYIASACWLWHQKPYEIGTLDPGAVPGTSTNFMGVNQARQCIVKICVVFGEIPPLSVQI